MDFNEYSLEALNELHTKYGFEFVIEDGRIIGTNDIEEA